MNGVNQQLLDYITEQVQVGVPAAKIKRVLLENDWSGEVLAEAFARLGVVVPEHDIPTAEMVEASQGVGVAEKSFVTEEITMDKVIEKFIPIAGALFLVVGFGYLIYANAWVHLAMEIRLTLGFFFSVVLIGASFSFSEKMRYLADVGIGMGVLLLYGTLIYGSRATELAQEATIPEMMTLITAVLFTVAVSYFASKRNSKVILILGMLGAYITPFVIGQNDVWVENVSFNAYLIYFFAINMAVFFLGREISVRDIIPLNIVGLFIGVSTLWGLSSSDGINTTRPDNFLSGELFTAIMFMILVIFSIWSILLSAKKFSEKDDGYLSLGYLAPIIWFAFNVNNLDSLSDVAIGILYAIIAASCFVGWHILLGTKTKFQHTALYATGLISAFLSVFAFFEEFDVLTSMLISYSSLIFGFLYIIGTEKSERFISYIAVSLTGSVLSLKHILEADLPYETLLIVAALLPAMAAYFIAKYGNERSFLSVASAYSVVWSLVAGIFVIAEFIEYIDLNFMMFYLLPLTLLGYLAYINKAAIESMTHDARSRMFRLVMFWFAFGFAPVFFTLVVSIYPAPTDTYIFTHTDAPTDWILIKGIFATAILFIGLYISRKLQLEQVIKRPSFILVIFGFATLVLTGNYIISAIANDLNIAHVDGGPRAIATTIWWASIAIYMLYKGIKLGKKYHAEKLLGLLLLGITLVKVILYDIATMEMQGKIIVLMIVGGAMLLFSYRVRAKNMLQTSEPPTGH